SAARAHPPSRAWAFGPHPPLGLGASGARARHAPPDRPRMRRPGDPRAGGRQPLAREGSPLLERSRRGAAGDAGLSARPDRGAFSAELRVPRGARASPPVAAPLLGLRSPHERAPPPAPPGARPP